MLHRQKLELLRSSILSEDVKTLINDPLPKLESLPLDDPSVYDQLNQNFTLMQQVAEQVRAKLEQSHQQEDKQKARLANIMTNYNVFKQVFDSLIKKQLPRCRTLMKINAEYLKITIDK